MDEPKIRVTQNAMDRVVLNVRKRNKIRITEIKRILNKNLDFFENTKSKQWMWAQHLTRIKKNNCAKKILLSINFIGFGSKAK